MELITGDGGPVTQARENRLEPPILGDSPSGLWACSVLEGGAIPYELLRRRKGYPD